MKSVSLALIAALLCSGCATMIHGTYDTITVTSLEKGTRIYVDGAIRGMDMVGAQVERGKRHTITVEKDGFQSVTVETTKSFDATSLLGILIDFGIISIPVDLISGAAWKTDPTLYTVTPVPSATASAAAEPSPAPRPTQEPAVTSTETEEPRETFEEWSARQQQQTGGSGLR